MPDNLVSTRSATRTVPLTTARMKSPNIAVRGVGVGVSLLGSVFAVHNVLELFGFGHHPKEGGEEAAAAPAKGFKAKAVQVLSWLPDQMSRRTGDLVPESVTNGAATVFGGAQELLGKITKAPERAASRADRIKAQIGEMGNAAGLSESVRGYLQTASEALKGENAAAYRNAMTAAQDTLTTEKREVPSMWKDFSGYREAQKHNRDLTKAYHKATMPLNESAQADYNAAFWKNPKEAIADRLQNQSVVDTVYDVVRVGNIGLSFVHEGRNTIHGYHTIRQLHSDLTGSNAKDVGLFTLARSYFSSKTPPLLKKSIGKYYLNTATRWAFLLGGTWAQNKAQQVIAKNTGGHRGKQAIASMAVMKLFGTVEGALAAPDPTIMLYESLHNMQHAGVKLLKGRDPDMHHEAPTQPNYSRLIVTALPQLESQGAVHSKTVNLVATHFEENQTPISEVMQILSAGAPAVEALAQKLEAARIARIEQKKVAAEQAPDQEQAPGISSRPQRKAREIIGNHTRKVVNSDALALSKNA